MNRLSLLSRESGRLGLDPAEQRFRPSGLSEQSITAATISAYYRPESFERVESLLISMVQSMEQI